MGKCNETIPQVALFGSLIDGSSFGDRKGTTKKLCDKDSAERSGELSGAICLKTIILSNEEILTMTMTGEETQNSQGWSEMKTPKSNGG